MNPVVKSSTDSTRTDQVSPILIWIRLMVTKTLINLADFTKTWVNGPRAMEPTK